MPGSGKIDPSVGVEAISTAEMTLLSRNPGCRLWILPCQNTPVTTMGDLPSAEMNANVVAFESTARSQLSKQYKRRFKRVGSCGDVVHRQMSIGAMFSKLGATKNSMNPEVDSQKVANKKASEFAS